jgi:DNA-binding NtrC family response regulator
MNRKILIVEDQFIEADYLRTMLEKAGYTVCGIARSVQKARELITAETPGLVLLDIFLSGKLTGIDLAEQLKEENIAFVYLSANSNEEVLNAAKATEPYGFLVKPFREKDLLVTLEIARYRHEHSLGTALRREAALQAQLQGIIAERTSLQQKWLMTSRALQPHIPFDYFEVAFNSPENILHYGCSFLRVSFDEYQELEVNGLLKIAGITMPEFIRLQAIRPFSPGATAYDEKAFEKECAHVPFKKLLANTFHLKSHLAIPMPLASGKTFHFCFYSRRPDAYHTGHVALFHRIQALWISSIDSIFAKEDKATKKDPSYENQIEVPTVKPLVNGFAGIIGNSHLLLNVFDQMTQVASSDTSVLILGESGTGKEGVADSIHRLSPRKDKPFVKVNCAALPPSLIESELFGHEKGAFTGAADKRIGKFEKADRGTIFLDEVGELALELQVKLLRVLQEKEIERIGSRDPTRIDVRIIAATNRNLEKEVAEGRFRLDLYYRLNVFPILLPPLRDRKDDIPLLAAHFINHYSRKSGKKISGLSSEVMKSMIAYDWPGNIRQLEHLMERSVLVAKGPTIDENPIGPLAGTKVSSAPVPEEGRMKTIHENERDYIISVLKKCKGRVWGQGGAAEILNVPPSTLKSKMKKLGIKKEYIKTE